MKNKYQNTKEIPKVLGRSTANSLRHFKGAASEAVPKTMMEYF